MPRLVAVVPWWNGRRLAWMRSPSTTQGAVAESTSYSHCTSSLSRCTTPSRIRAFSLAPVPSVHKPPRCNPVRTRSEEHTSELQSRGHLVCRLRLEKKNYHVTNKETYNK